MVDRSSSTPRRSRRAAALSVAALAALALPGCSPSGTPPRRDPLPDVPLPSSGVVLDTSVADPNSDSGAGSWFVSYAFVDPASYKDVCDSYEQQLTASGWDLVSRRAIGDSVAIEYASDGLMHVWVGCGPHGGLSVFVAPDWGAASTSGPSGDNKNTPIVDPSAG